MLAAGQRREHRNGMCIVLWFSHPLAVEGDLGVRRDRHFPVSRDRRRLGSGR